MFSSGFEFAPGFRLQKKIGKGQFGQVWEAVSPGGVPSAVKLVELSREESKWKIEYEGIQRVKKVRHPNLMPITAVWALDQHGRALHQRHTSHPQSGETAVLDIAESLPTVPQVHHEPCGNDSPEADELLDAYEAEPRWLAIQMALAEQNLLELLRECEAQRLPGIPVDQLLDLMQTAARGLDYLNGLLTSEVNPLHHGDVKPANIVLQGGSAVMCDFGLATILKKVPSEPNRTSHSGGTPAYMSPETYRGEPTDQSDQYSFAITYYQLRTGTYPFERGLRSGWLRQVHLDGRLNFSAVPPAEQQVLRIATALQPQQRYRSSGQFVSALRDAVQESKALGQAETNVFVPREQTDTAVAADTALQTTVGTATDSQQDKPHGGKTAWRNGLIAGTLVALLVLGFALLRENGSRLDPDPLVASNVAIQWADLLANVGTDLPDAVDQFSSLLAEQGEQHPYLLNPLSVRLTGHTQKIKQIVFSTGPPSNNGSAPQFLVSQAWVPYPCFFPLQPIWTDYQNHWESAVGQSHQELTQTFSWPESPELGPEHLQFTKHLSPTPDGRWIASSGTDGQLRIWRPADNGVVLLQQPIALGNFSDTRGTKVDSILWHPDQQNLLVAAPGDNLEQIVHWFENQVTTGTVPWVLRHSLPLEHEIAEWFFASAGKTLVYRSVEGPVYAVDWEDLRQTQSGSSLKVRQIGRDVPHAQQIKLLPAANSDQDVVVIHDDGDDGGAVKFYPVIDGIKCDLQRVKISGLESMTVHGTLDAFVIVASDPSGALYRFDPQGGGLQKSHRANDPVEAMAISPDGSYVVSVTLAGAAILQSLAPDHFSDRAFAFLHYHTSLTAVAWSPDSRWLAVGCEDGGLLLWDTWHLRLLLHAQVPVSNRLDVPAPLQPTLSGDAVGI